MSKWRKNFPPDQKAGVYIKAKRDRAWLPERTCTGRWVWFRLVFRAIVCSGSVLDEPVLLTAVRADDLVNAIEEQAVTFGFTAEPTREAWLTFMREILLSAEVGIKP